MCDLEFGETRWSLPEGMRCIVRDKERQHYAHAVVQGGKLLITGKLTPEEIERAREFDAVEDGLAELERAAGIVRD